ncbi:HAD domain-containing protein [Streptomyces sp. NPDC050145]|uniref:HAD domain-containing protein n=1 Tax=Streptomyces sp. NPDC050145 TaxID=3365602 RepID=UPI003797B72B
MTHATAHPLPPSLPFPLPFLFLDIDGPLIPFGVRSGPADPLDRLDPAAGARLLELDCRMVWATTWMEDANEIVGPRLGLPRLPVLSGPDSNADSVPSLRGLHWKTPLIVEWAAAEPFIWVDDEIGALDRDWVAAAHPGPFLLHRVDPARGLTDADFAALGDWLRALARRGPA